MVSLCDFEALDVSSAVTTTGVEELCYYSLLMLRKMKLLKVDLLLVQLNDAYVKIVCDATNIIEEDSGSYDAVNGVHNSEAVALCAVKVKHTSTPTTYVNTGPTNSNTKIYKPAS